MPRRRAFPRAFPAARLVFRCGPGTGQACRTGPGPRPKAAAAGRMLMAIMAAGLAACAQTRPAEDTIRDPDTSSRTRVALTAEAAGQPEIALSMYQAAAAAAPEDAAAQARYAAALGRTGQMQNAEQVLVRALGRRPRDPALLIALGQLRVRSGAAPEAVAVFDQLLAQRPRDIAALNGRSVALDLLGRHAEAQQGYRAVQAIDPSNIPAANKLAMSLLLDNQATEAVTILAGLRQRNGAPPRVATNLGIAQAASGDLAMAQATLEGRIEPSDLDRLVASLGSAAAIPTGAAVPIETAPSPAETEPVPAPVVRRPRRPPPERAAEGSQ